MRFLLPCIEGIEDVVAADALALGAREADPRRGRVLVDADEGFLYRANLAHPTASRVLLVLADAPVETLDDVARLVRSIAWEDVFGIDSSFAGDALRVGTHPFTSLDVAKAVGEGVIARFREATGERPRVDLNAPDVTVHAQVHDAHAYVGIDTTGDALHRRGYRVYQHRAPLAGPLASALVALSGWRAGLLLDPMCGAGTIPIEADFRARGRAVNLARPDWAFRRLGLFDEEAFERERDRLACGALDAAPSILGGELDARHVDGARQNASAAGADGVRFLHEDATRLARPEGLAAVVTNPPWGLRVASRSGSDRINAQLRAKLAEWAKGGAYTAVVLMGNRRFEKHEPLPQAVRDVHYGGTECRVLVYRL